MEYITLKKRWKNSQFLTKTRDKPLCKNANFSTFGTFCFYCLKTRFFVLQYRKTHFPGLYCLKKKDGKMAIFWPKPWTNPFRKMAIFPLFGLLACCFYSLEKSFFLLQYRKTHFPGLYCLQKKMEKSPLFDQNPGPTPLEKWQFFHFLNFLLL